MLSFSFLFFELDPTTPFFHSLNLHSGIKTMANPIHEALMADVAVQAGEANIGQVLVQEEQGQPPSSFPSSLPRRCVSSLSSLCQIQILRQIHTVASKMEEEYMDTWMQKLSAKNLDLEQSTNIRLSELNTEEVVLKFRSQQEEEMQRRKEEFLSGQEGQNGDKNTTGGKVRGNGNRLLKWMYNNTDVICSFQTKKKRKAKGARKAPYGKVPLTEEALLKKLQPKMINGIPSGVDPASYIQYRKCKYVEDIKAVRTFLCDQLNPGVLNELMATLHNIAQFNEKQEHGLLTLQAMLMNTNVNHFKMASAKFYQNFQHDGMSLDNHIETKIGTTILHFTLVEGSRMTHLSLERCACDSLLKVLADVAPNLKYLNINRSMVSDQGLFYLCGIEKGIERERPKLARRCKDDKKEEAKLVSNECPQWVKKRPGCEYLDHLYCEGLSKIPWISVSAWMGQIQNVPVDSGFVAVLVYLPQLKVFITEFGARVVVSFEKAFTKYLNKKKMVMPELR